MIQLQDVPRAYTYCFAGRDKCPKCATCLRAIAARLLEQSEDPQPQTLHTVNACYVDRLPDFSACPLYRPDTPVRFARGMMHLFDEVPVKQAAELRARIVGCFSCERYFYLSRNGKRLITPEEQRRITAVFRDMGLAAAPRFDGYEQALVW